MKYSYNSQPKKNNKQKKSYFRFFLFIIFIAGICYFLVFSKYFQIKEVTLEGNRELKDYLLIEEIKKKLIGKKKFIIPASSIVFFSKSHITKQLKQQFPKIDTVEVYKKYPNAIEIKISEKRPVAVWCSSNKIEIDNSTSTEEIIINISENNNKEEKIEIQKHYIFNLNKDDCFYIDETGLAFEKISEIELDLLDKNMIKMQEWKTDKIELAKDSLNIEFLAFAKILKGELKEILNMNMGKFIIPNSLAKELYVISSAGWKIYFSTEEEAKIQIERLKVILNKQISEKERLNLDYIDLRAGEKVFYKFR